MILDSYRSEVRAEIEQITPFDEKERVTKQNVLSWIDSGKPLCRVKKPDVPDKHLVSYFLLIDGDHILLVDHINARLWLPTGGHVEPNEHPRAAVTREAKEELDIDAVFTSTAPTFLTSTITVGYTAGHVDVSIWYVLKGDRRKPLAFDASEFNEVQWFHREKVPFGRTDPELSRFLDKHYSINLTKR